MQMTFTDLEAAMVFNGLPHVGPVTLNLLKEHLGLGAAGVLACKKSELMKVPGVGPKIADVIFGWEQYFDLDKEMAAVDKKGAAFIPSGDNEYPPLLENIYDPAVGLYAFGGCRPKEKCIAIVGSRRCTLYGQGMAKRIAGELAKLDFCVVSGMARGIDSAAHEGALAVGGKTAAVLGSGLNIIYPPENKDLYERISENGVVFSEFMMNRRADRQTFPMRNRLVSGMSQAVIVIETDSHGGSMITAKIAAEQGRHVFAVPGRVDQVSSRGCHDLIRDGATLLTCVDDLLQELSYLGQLELDLTGQPKREAEVALDLSNLDEKESAVLKVLYELSKGTLDDIFGHLELPQEDIAAVLLMLELKKKVKKRLDGCFEVFMG